MLSFILFAMAIEMAHIGWYGAAAIAAMTSVANARWLWFFLAAFCAGRMLRR